jgi:hypothetical protein
MAQLWMPPKRIWKSLRPDFQSKKKTKGRDELKHKRVDKYLRSYWKVLRIEHYPSRRLHKQNSIYELLITEIHRSHRSGYLLSPPTLGQ